MKAKATFELSFFFAYSTFLLLIRPSFTYSTFFYLFDLPGPARRKPALTWKVETDADLEGLSKKFYPLTI